MEHTEEERSRIIKTYKELENIENEADESEIIDSCVCDVCGKILSKKTIESHKLLHSHNRSHKCSFCDKSFATVTNLRVSSLLI